MRKMPDLPKLGIGLVWWPELDALCSPAEGLVQVIEAEPETFWLPRTAPKQGFTSRLPGALAHLPQRKLLHGVGAPFGGPAAQTPAHRATLAADIRALRPAWISDHLSFDRFTTETDDGARDIFTGFFLPPAQNTACVARAAAHIGARRENTGLPVAFETPVSYLPPLPGELPDGAFAAAVSEAADCGILLDLHNLLCNERNGRQSVQDFCAAIPLDRVWEIHLAGGAAERGFWLDAHSGVAEPALMDILAGLVPKLPSLGAIVFEIVPEFVAATGLRAIADMLGRLNDIWSTRPASRPGQARGPRAAPRMKAADPIPPALWESLLGGAVTGRAGPVPPPELAAWMHQAEAPLALYKYLAQEGRASALVTSVPRTIRLLLHSLGEMQTRGILAQFWREAAPAYTSAEEGRAFLDFIVCAGDAMPDLCAAIAVDRAWLACG